MKYCCKDMECFFNIFCDNHSSTEECPDKIISYNIKFNEYGIIIHDGGTSSIIINYCPWCGKKLPESKRDLWFQTLENMGYENFDDEKIPQKFKTNEWYIKD